MLILTLEGVVEHGQLKLTTPIPLPDHTKVSVVISEPSKVTCPSSLASVEPMVARTSVER